MCLIYSFYYWCKSWKGKKIMCTVLYCTAVALYAVCTVSTVMALYRGGPYCSAVSAVSGCTVLHSYFTICWWRPQGFQPMVHDRFNCFSNMWIPLQLLEHLSDNNKTARICSHPEHANGPHKPPKPARYDTILMWVNEQGCWMGGFKASQSSAGQDSKNSMICNGRTAHSRSLSHIQATTSPWPLPTPTHLCALVQATSCIWQQCQNVLFWLLDGITFQMQ